MKLNTFLKTGVVGVLFSFSILVHADDFKSEKKDTENCDTKQESSESVSNETKKESRRPYHSIGALENRF